MSEQQVTKYQMNRPDPLKPSVVKEYGLWWMKVYDQAYIYRTHVFHSHADALMDANQYAAGQQ